MTVYIDLLFLINFSMDFLCFYLTCVILHRKFSTARVFLASSAGGAYSVAALFIEAGEVVSLVADILVCASLCAIVFLRRGVKESFLLCFAVYFAVSMALGGFMTALFNLLNRLELPLDEIEPDGISVWTFALLAIISALITLFGGRFFLHRASGKRAELEITYGGKSERLCALCDSGNLLREPISNKACIVADTDALQRILPTALFFAAKKGDIGEILSLGGADMRSIRIVPARTAVGESGLIAFRPQRLTIDSGRGAREIDALVVLTKLEKSAEGALALVPSELMI